MVCVVLHTKLQIYCELYGQTVKGIFKKCETINDFFTENTKIEICHRNKDAVNLREFGRG